MDLLWLLTMYRNRSPCEGESIYLRVEDYPSLQSTKVVTPETTCLWSVRSTGQSVMATVDLQYFGSGSVTSSMLHLGLTHQPVRELGISCYQGSGKNFTSERRAYNVKISLLRSDVQVIAVYGDQCSRHIARVGSTHWRGRRRKSVRVDRLWDNGSSSQRRAACTSTLTLAIVQSRMCSSRSVIRPDTYSKKFLQLQRSFAASQDP